MNYEITVADHKLNVTVDDTLVKRITKVASPGAYSIGIDNVIVTSTFSRLSQKTQEVILMREVAHAELGHLNNVGPDRHICLGPHDETDADVWTARRVGSVTLENALREMVRLTITVVKEKSPGWGELIENSFYRDLESRIGSYKYHL